jgi:hypothetical protein
LGEYGKGAVGRKPQCVVGGNTSVHRVAMRGVDPAGIVTSAY